MEDVFRLASYAESEGSVKHHIFVCTLRVGVAHYEKL